MDTALVVSKVCETGTDPKEAFIFLVIVGRVVSWRCDDISATTVVNNLDTLDVGFTTVGIIVVSILENTPVRILVDIPVTGDVSWADECSTEVGMVASRVAT